MSREGLRATLWVLASLTLSVLLWREPSGLWPAGLLTAQLLALGFLSRLVASPAFTVAVPLAGITVLARTLFADDTMARVAAEVLGNVYLVMRVLACVALAIAGNCLAGSGASRHADQVGRMVSGTAGVVLLFVLSQAWTRYQGLPLREGGRKQIRRGRGDSLEDAGGAFRAVDGLRRGHSRLGLQCGARRALRYAALGLFGLVIVKVFIVDLASVKTLYRMLSFLILGVVLLLVGLLYQKASRRPRAAGASRLPG